MADEKISALPSAGALAGTEPLPIVQGGVTKKTTVQDVANLVTAGGNASITPITVAGLQTLQSTSALSTTTIYETTDSTPYVLRMQFEANNQDTTTATILDANYGGTVLYTVSTNTWSNGTIYDANKNIWNGVLPIATTLGAGSDGNVFYSGSSLTAGINANGNVLHHQASSIVMGDDCEYNVFGERSASNTLGNSCIYNTFKQGANSFIFGDNLQNVTIEAGTTGDDYTASPDYDFLYSNGYPATIFRSGGINYHRYFDVANDRIVITDLATPANVSYIGGSGGTGDVVGPASAVNNNIAVFDTTTGKLIKDGGATVASKLDVAAAANYRLTVSDGSGNRGNASAITASRALKSDANGVPTHFDTATEPSLTELSYVKGVTSAIQTQFGAKQDTLVSATNIKTINGSSILGAGDLTVSAAGSPIANCTAGTAVTGTTSNTYSKGLLIPANSRTTNDAPDVVMRIAKTGTAGTVVMRMYWNTTDDLSGSPILIGTIPSAVSATLANTGIRTLAIEEATGGSKLTRVYAAATGIQVDDIAVSVANSALSIDWALDGYLICAIQNGSALDSSVCNMIKLH